MTATQKQLDKYNYVHDTLQGRKMGQEKLSLIYSAVGIDGDITVNHG